MKKIVVFLLLAALPAHAEDVFCQQVGSWLLAFLSGDKGQRDMAIRLSKDMESHQSLVGYALAEQLDGKPRSYLVYYGACRQLEAGNWRVLD